jgi:hypothetical protein
MAGYTIYDERIKPLFRAGDENLNPRQLLEELFKRCRAEKEKCAGGDPEFQKWAEIEEGLKLSERRMNRPGAI